jgi:hypothetical protein
MNDIKPSSMDELIESLNNLPNNYIYRGHSSETWRLQSTLERVLADKFETESGKYEDYSLNHFKSKFHLYDNANEKPKTKLEWLSIMQHYGVPTRMIDFTSSPYVALYFALENANKKDCESFALYAINYRDILKKSLEFIRNRDKSITSDYGDLEYKQDELFDKIIDIGSYEVLWVVEPNISNLRLDRQSGCFLISGSTKTSIEYLLSNSMYNGIENHKIIISGKFWDNIYTLLVRMNITSKTIYGDLEGLSKSIKMFMKAYS